MAPKPLLDAAFWEQRRARHAWLDELDEFLRTLAEEKLIRLSVGDRLRAAQLLHLLAAEGEGLDEPARVAGWLAPVFCRSEEEQRLFHRRLVAWVEAQQRTAGAGAVRASVAAQTDGPTAGERSLAQARWRERLGLSLVVLMAALVVVVSFLIWYIHGSDSSAIRGPDSSAEFDIFSILARPALALLPVLSLVLWFWLRRRRDAMLFRGLAPEDAASERRFFEASDRVLFRPGPFRRDLRALRRHVRAPSSEIAVECTIAATCEAGGLVTLQYDTRRVLSEYVLLVDRRSSWDHLATIGDLLEERLRAAHVSCHRYDFLSDPRRAIRVRSNGGAGTMVSLDEMLTYHEGHILLVVTDGEPFLDPITRAPPRWVDRLSAFSFVALLTPVAYEAWADREQVLAKMKFRLFHATPEGIARLVTMLDGGGASATGGSSVSSAKPFARLYTRLDADRRRYLSTMPPPEEETKMLLGGLESVLGAEAFELLCAVAVFPEIRPKLTIFLGARLKDQRGLPLLDEVRMGSLAQLVWLREGFMPEWLRKVLIARLSAERANNVHDALYAFLSTQATGQSGIHLDLAPKDRGKAWDWFRRGARSDPSSPLNDRLFLALVRTRNPSAVLAPPHLAELLGPKINRRDILVSVYALLTASALWWRNQGAVFSLLILGFSALAIVLPAKARLLNLANLAIVLPVKARLLNLANLAILIIAGAIAVAAIALNPFLRDTVIPIWVKSIQIPRGE